MTFGDNIYVLYFFCVKIEVYDFSYIPKYLEYMFSFGDKII